MPKSGQNENGKKASGASTHDAPPTLEDVARHANVSTATVSRCINTPKVVAPSTLARVQGVIGMLGYTPNFAARSMAAKRTFTVGAIIPTMDNAIFARGIQAFQEELHGAGYTLLVSSTTYQAKVEEEQIKTLVARGADGLLLIGHDRDPAVYAYLKRQRIPAIIAWSYQRQHPVPSIGFDNFDAMRALAAKVIDAGHSRIAMISGVSAQNDRARLRIAGLRAAMEAGGLSPTTLDPVEVHYSFRRGAEAFMQVMNRTPRPTAVLCGNDVLAVGALRGARQMGLRVPHDVSITGFDDVELAKVCQPELTTVHVPHREMGRLAARELVAMITQNRAGQSQELATRVIHRASLSRPPALQTERASG